MRENHTRTISMRLSDEPQFDHPRSQQFRHETYIVGFLTGDRVMWIVFYIATIASLSALGLAPNLLPEETDDDSDA
jgi:hypothetical protein